MKMIHWNQAGIYFAGLALCDALRGPSSPDEVRIISRIDAAVRAIGLEIEHHPLTRECRLDSFPPVSDNRKDVEPDGSPSEFQLEA
jgi:hypothetical protein